MKNKVFPPLILAACVAVGIFCFYNTGKKQTGKKVKHIVSKEEKEGEEELSKQYRIDKAIEQEFEMTKDPATNEVPRQRLKSAYRTLLDKEAAIKNGSRAGIDITWEERGPNNVAGRTRTILIDENDAPNYRKAWVGSVGGGLWMTNDISVSNPAWVEVNPFFDNLAVTSIAQDPSNPNNIYFGTGEGYFNSDAIRGFGIWKSTDGGATWNQLASTSSFFYTQKIVINASGDIFACTRTYGVQKSTDGGTTWTKVLGSGGVGAATNRASDIEIAANGDLYATMGIFNTDGIYKSTNNGTSWTKLTSGLPASNYERIEIALAPSNSNVAYALFHSTTDNNVLGIYRTTDGGATWTARTNPSAFGMTNFARGQAWYDLIAAVDPNNSNRVFIGGIDLLGSTDGGSTWTQVSQWYGGGGFQYVHADQHAITFQPGSSTVCYFGNDGGVYRTANANATTPTIPNRNTGYNVTQYYACAIAADAESNIMIAGAQDNGTQAYGASGMNSTNEVYGGDGAFCHIDQDNSNIQIASYVYNSFAITANNWGGNTNVDIGTNAGRFINPTDYDSDANILYSCYNAGQYSLITNVGSTNNSGTRTIAAFGGNTISAVTTDPNTANRVWFGLGNGDVVRVDNANAGSPTATNLSTGLPTGYLSSIAIEEGNANHLLVTYSNYGVNSVWETTNGGSSWTSVEGDLPDMPVRSVIFDPNSATRALLGTELGVWSTTNLSGGSTTWSPSNVGLANVRTDYLQSRSSDKLIAAATHGRGLFTASLDDAAVKFINATVNVTEGTNCKVNKTLDVPLQLSKTLTNDVEVTITTSLVGTDDASSPADYTISSTLVTIPAGQTTANLSINIVQDAIIENNEFIQVEIGTVATNPVTSPSEVQKALTNQSCLITVLDDDTAVANPKPSQNLVNVDFEAGLSSFTTSNDGGGTDVFITGSIPGANSTYLQFSNTNTSTFAYINEDANNSNANDVKLISPVLDLTGYNGASLNFDYALVAATTGEKGEVLISTDGGTSWAFLQGLSSTGTDLGGSIFEANWSTGQSIDLSAYVGLSNVKIAFVYSDGGNWSYGMAVDNVTISGATYIELDVNETTSYASVNLGPFETVYFKDASSGHLIAKIENLSSHDYGCTDVKIVNQGSGYTTANITSTDIELLSKNITVTPTTNNPSGIYNLSLYFTTAEVNGWLSNNTYSYTLANLAFYKGVTDVTTVSALDKIELTNGPITSPNFGDDYVFTANFTTGFSGFGVGGGGVSVPVELLSFQGEITNKGNLLTWATATEINNSHFNLQYKSNEAATFETIARIEGNGDSSEEIEYEYLHNTESQKTYYRLEQVDFDGKTSYSNIVILNNKDQEWFTVFPNPASEKIFLNGNTRSINTSIEVNIFDINGKKVKTSIFDMENQTLDTSIKLTDLSSGTYLVQILLGESQWVQKILKQ